MSASTVLLVHGMGRTPVSMWRLARALRGAGVATEQFAYATAWESVDGIVRRLQRRLIALAAADYVVVGHSLGGLLLRAAIGSLPDGVHRPGHLIMLGTPNRSPRLARRFEHSWWYRLLNGDAGALLASEARLARIPSPDMPCTIVAGTRGVSGRWSPFGREPNDGLVAMSETQLDGCLERIEVPARHPFLMNDATARRVILRTVRGEK